MRPGRTVIPWSLVAASWVRAVTTRSRSSRPGGVLRAVTEEKVAEGAVRQTVDGLPSSASSMMYGPPPRHRLQEPCVDGGVVAPRRRRPDPFGPGSPWPCAKASARSTPCSRQRDLQSRDDGGEQRR